jgi:hypothetical protein
VHAICISFRHVANGHFVAFDLFVDALEPALKTATADTHLRCVLQFHAAINLDIFFSSNAARMQTGSD